MDRRMTQQLVCNALSMALFRRGFPKYTTIHSDRGSLYYSHGYERLIKRNELRGGSRRRVACYDNAVTESVYRTLKVELIHRERQRTRDRAQSSIFEYIETYDNRQRKHSASRRQIPMVFEMAA